MNRLLKVKIWFSGYEIRKAVDEKGDGVYATKEFKGKTATFFLKKLTTIQLVKQFLMKFQQSYALMTDDFVVFIVANQLNRLIKQSKEWQKIQN